MLTFRRGYTDVWTPVYYREETPELHNNAKRVMVLLCQLDSLSLSSVNEVPKKKIAINTKFIAIISLFVLCYVMGIKNSLSLA